MMSGPPLSFSSARDIALATPLVLLTRDSADEYQFQLHEHREWGTPRDTRPTREDARPPARLQGRRRLWPSRRKRPHHRLPRAAGHSRWSRASGATVGVLRLLGEWRLRRHLEALAGTLSSQAVNESSEVHCAPAPRLRDKQSIRLRLRESDPDRVSSPPLLGLGEFLLSLLLVQAPVLDEVGPICSLWTWSLRTSVPSTDESSHHLVSRCRPFLGYPPFFVTPAPGRTCLAGRHQPLDAIAANGVLPQSTRICLEARSD